MEWIALYGVLWLLTLLWSFVTSRWRGKGPRYEKLWEGGSATLSLLAGGAAVGFVAMGLEADIGVFIIVVLALGAGAAIGPALLMGGPGPKNSAPKNAAGNQADRKQDQARPEGNEGADPLAWFKTSDVKKQEQIIAKLQDQNKLCAAAIHSPHKIIRHHALNKLTDEALLMEVVRQTGDQEIFAKAASMITDEDFLVGLVLNIPPYELNGIFTRLGPLARLQEEGLLKAMVQKLHDHGASRCTSSGGTSKGCSEDDKKIFQTLVDKIGDKAFLADLVLDQEACPAYREIALAAIEDPDMLFSITLQSGYGAEHVDRYSPDQIDALLCQLDVGLLRPVVQHLAQNKKALGTLSKEAKARLLQFLEHDSHADNFPWVISLVGKKGQAYGAIQDMLVQQVRKVPWHSKANYLEHVTDTTHLADIARQACDEKLACMALDRIKDPEQVETIRSYRESHDLHDWQPLKGPCKQCSQCGKEEHGGGTEEVVVGQLAVDTVCKGCGAVLHSHMRD